jgi:tRNA nucleotidyltransferase (CCA-adding enzyme)
LIAAGLKPGKEFKTILHEAFEAQLEGKFSELAGAEAWLRSRLG